MDWVIQICREGGVWRAGEANGLEVWDPACLGRMPTDLARCRKDGLVLEVSIVATHPWTCLKSEDKGGQWPSVRWAAGWQISVVDSHEAAMHQQHEELMKYKMKEEAGGKQENSSQQMASLDR